MGNSTPTPMSIIVHLPLASGSALKKLRASQSSERSPKKAVSERTRKKTNANEITDDEWIVVTERLTKLREQLTHVQVKDEKKNEIQEMMEGYVMHCETAMQTGKGEDQPKDLQTKLDEENRERQETAKAKVHIPSKTAETAAHSSATTTLSISPSAPEKGNETEQEKRREKQIEEAEVVSIESDAESISGLRIDEPGDGTPQQSAGTGSAMQSASGDTGATTLLKDVQAPMEVEQEQEETEIGAEVESNIQTLEESAKDVAIPSTRTSIPIYKSVLNSPTPTPTPIYSSVPSTSVIL